MKVKGRDCMALKRMQALQQIMYCFMHYLYTNTHLVMSYQHTDSYNWGTIVYHLKYAD